MAFDAAKFSGSIPDYYNRAMVPIMFTDCANDMAQRVAAAKPTHVLELAAGTGVVTQALRNLLPAQASILATDLNEGMLTIAKNALDGAVNLSFEAADATALPFADQRFDAVACQFGVMFFPDKAASYREVFRVLKPGGHYFFNVWDGLERNAFARVPSEAMGSFFGGAPPAFFGVPTGYNKLDPIRDELAKAGFVDFFAQVLRIEKDVPDVAGFARGLVLGSPVIREIETRPGFDREGVIGSVIEAMRAALGGDPGHISMQAIVFGARRP